MNTTWNGSLGNGWYAAVVATASSIARNGLDMPVKHWTDAELLEDVAALDDWETSQPAIALYHHRRR
jgi:hypothetical protein